MKLVATSLAREASSSQLTLGLDIIFWATLQRIKLNLTAVEPDRLHWTVRGQRLVYPTMLGTIWDKSMVSIVHPLNQWP